MRDPDLETLLEARGWQTPAARDLTLWLVTLTTPTLVLRPWWAARVAYAALTGRRKAPHRG